MSSYLLRNKLHGTGGTGKLALLGVQGSHSEISVVEDLQDSGLQGGSTIGK